MAVKTTREKLNEAREAYHTMMMGGAIRVVVDQNQERIEYSTANPQRLLQYIAYLENLLLIESGAVRVRGPAGVTF